MLGHPLEKEMYEFTKKFFSTDKLDEEIVLQIGVEENNDWKLTLCQRR